MTDLFPGGITVHRRVKRLTFEYEGTDVRLVGSQTVDMALVGWDPLRDGADGHGFWAELEDGAGNVIYRRVLQDPTHEAEVFAPSGEIGRSTRPRKGTFVVLVPDLDPAIQVVLRGSFEAEGRARSSREIGRFVIPPREQPVVEPGQETGPGPKQ